MKSLTPAQESTVIDLVADDKMMEAAQYVQSILNCSLEEAIEAVDGIITGKMNRGL